MKQPSPRKLRRLHVKKSYSAYSRHLSAACSEPCGHYAEKAADALMARNDTKAEKYLDLYSRCKRACFESRLGKKYKKARGF